MTKPTFSEFATVFRENILARSRSARGIADTTAHALKAPLRESGESLAAHVARNTDALLEAVWRDATASDLSPQAIRAMMERWYDIINDGLIDPDAYRAEREKLAAIAQQRSAQSGIVSTINPRYRVWDLPYTRIRVALLDLDALMERFYESLSAIIAEGRAGTIAQAEALAYADHMLDSAIHPWADGCGRHATATVMWLSLLVPSWRLPRFSDRAEHYASIGDLNAHTAYYEHCLSERKGFEHATGTKSPSP